jgi:biopolymer transport protein ExbB
LNESSNDDARSIARAAGMAVRYVLPRSKKRRVTSVNSLIERVKSAMVGLGTGWILMLMLLLSVISLAIMLERVWLYWSLRDDIDDLMRDMGRLLRGGDLDGARQRLEASRSAEAAVMIAGLVEADRGADAADEAMQGASALQRLKLEKRLAFLGTLGNNAPFIGLLGTVIGIVAAFDELSKVKMAAASGATQLAPEAVMGRISEALVATAIGILIAIPAVAAYNAFQRVVRGTIANTEALSHMLLSYLKAVPGSGVAGVAGSGERGAGPAEPKGPSSSSAERADGGPRGN